MPDIIAEVNSKIVNWIDVMFNLENGTCKPFKNPRDEMENTHAVSSHTTGRALRVADTNTSHGLMSHTVKVEKQTLDNGFSSNQEIFHQNQNFIKYLLKNMLILFSLGDLGLLYHFSKLFKITQVSDLV